jgi:uncharacterized membrane protein (DUF373 family)
MKHGDSEDLATELPDRPSTLGHTAEHWLELGDQAIYVAAAILFLAAAAAMGGYSVITFIRHIGDDFPFQLVTFINDLLLVLIILEILGTVRSYLLTGTTSLAPFLYIGIISATRRILAIGAASTLGAAISETEFRDRMIDLGANGGVVLALAVALYLFGRRQTSSPSDPGTEFDK